MNLFVLLAPKTQCLPHVLLDYLFASLISIKYYLVIIQLMDSLFCFGLYMAVHLAPFLTLTDCRQTFLKQLLSAVLMAVDIQNHLLFTVLCGFGDESWITHESWL